MAPAMLGVAGDLVKREHATPWATKAGGAAVLFAGLPGEAVRSHAVCPLCAGPLSLVMQVHGGRVRRAIVHAFDCCAATLQAIDMACAQACAPWTAPPGSSRISLLDRALLLLVCTQPGCCHDARAWKLLRCHVQPHAEPAVAPAPAPAPKHATEWGPSARPATEQTATPVASPQAQSALFCAPSASAAAPDLFDFSDLNSDLDALTRQFEARQLSSAAAPASKGKPARAADAPLLEQHGHVLEMGPDLPEFWITAAYEPPARASPVAQGSHITELLQQYQAAEAVPEASSSSARVRHLLCNPA